MNAEIVKRDIAAFRQMLDVRDAKYRRNWMRYSNAGIRRDSIRSFAGQPFGMWQRSTDADTTPMPTVQVIKAIIDTFCSKMSQTKVRPFFNPVNGNYETRKIAREAQVFFDELFEKQKVSQVGNESLRNACIFDTGIAWVNEETGRVSKILPWEFYFDPAELHFDTLTRCFCRFENYPLISLKDVYAGSERKGELDGFLADYRGRKVEWVVFYDLANKERVDLINGEPVRTRALESSVWPFVMMYFTKPVAGYRTTGICDDLMGHQLTCDMLTQRIKDASELSPANAIFLDQNINIKASQISNRIGNIYNYTGTSGGQPPIVSTPRPIDPLYLQLLQYFVQDAHNVIGVSQLSAQSKKPSGLNSGVGLETLQDVESERFNVQLQNYINFFMDLSKVYMEVVPETLDVLPAKLGRARVTWKDVKRQREQFSIEFSSTSSLSKDPKVKMEQIEKLIQMGLVDKDYVASVLEMPDLEGVYSVSTAAHDAVQHIVARAIETGKVDFNEVVPLDMLYRECVLEISRLEAADEDQRTVDKVIALMVKVKQTMDKAAAASAPPPQQVIPAAPPAMGQQPPVA